MTNQEITAKISQLINYNINKEGITCKELAARKKLNYKSINAYANGSRIPRLRNYIIIYAMFADNLTRRDADFEQITGIPDAIFYKYRKRLVKDVSLLHAIIIIECFNLNFKIPGLID